MLIYASFHHSNPHMRRNIHLKKQIAAIFGAAAILSSSMTPPAVCAEITAAGKEATGILSDYLKIDTTNPPGNEMSGAKFLASVLKKEGIDSQVFEATPGRGCVYARLKGSGKKRPIILLNHIDVVPANAADWKHPPFSGEIHDGEIWGRGAIDMKGMGVAELEAMLMLKRSGCKLDRDIIFLGTPDEEVGGEHGANWFVKNHGDLIKDSEFLINEGFHIDTDSSGKPLYWGVDIAEKNVLWLKLTAKGEAGHASMPMPDSSTNRLTRALSTIVTNPPPPVVLPPVREFFKQISSTATDWRKQAYADIDKSVLDPKIYSELLTDRLKSPMLRNTVSLTVMKAGYKTNVIPAEAVAELDCRLLPGMDHQKFIEEIKKTINDPSIAIDVLEWQFTGASSYDTELFSAIKKVAAQETPGAPVVPVIVPWFTDSHWFRDVGIVSYGFEPFKIDGEHLATMHGKDERMPVAIYDDGIQSLFKILKELCCQK
jgi:acetylornithine deacetylase/succinyl-diaminopimelate desuccinylase-like protein